MIALPAIKKVHHPIINTGSCWTNICVIFIRPTDFIRVPRRPRKSDGGTEHYWGPSGSLYVLSLNRRSPMSKTQLQNSVLASLDTGATARALTTLLTALLMMMITNSRAAVE